MKRGFTLAEVLITLGVIGVVAAITIPTLIKNYQRQVWVNQLKKTYTTLSQGFQKMMADDGVDNIVDTEIFSKMYANAEDEECAFNNISDPACVEFFESFKKYFNIVEFAKYGDYVSFLDNSNRDNWTNDIFTVFSDGSMVQFDNTVTNFQEINIIIDVNGKRKPNQYGRDIFFFQLRKDGRLYPTGNSSDCPDVGDWSCAARIMENGWKMDY